MNVSEETLAELAHELRTAAAVITGYAELIELRKDERARLEAAAQIKAAAGRLTVAIERVLGHTETLA